MQQSLFFLRPMVVCAVLLVPCVMSLFSRSSAPPLSGCRSLLLLTFALLLAVAFGDSSSAPLVVLGCMGMAALVWAFTAEDEVAGWWSTAGLLIAEQWMRRPTVDDLHA